MCHIRRIKMSLDINKIYCQDCIEGMKALPDNSVDAIVTDPPYELNFMGKTWDSSGIAYNKEVWKQVLRVLKPGGHLLSFGGTRTYHRMACAIEDSGFEIRDMMQWLYGSGFPKGLDISKAIDKKLGVTREVIGKSNSKGIRSGQNHIVGDNYKCDGYNITAPASIPAKQWSGWGTALKPANEPMVLARKPLSEKTVADNVMRWGTGGINIDDSRIETTDNLNGGAYSQGKVSDGEWGTMHNFTGNKYVQPQGRFPANVLFDESAAAILDEQSGISVSKKSMRGVGLTGSDVYGSGDLSFDTMRGHNDSGGASRFFYCAKASKKERGEGNIHPTVKPISLMEYLVKLITKKGQTVLDPFMGSGTTALACIKSGRNYIGFEQNSDYVEIANKRIDSLTMTNPI